MSDQYTITVLEREPVDWQEVEKTYTVKELRETFGHDNKTIVSVLLNELERLRDELEDSESELTNTLAAEQHAYHCHDLLKDKLAAVDGLALGFRTESAEFQHLSDTTCLKDWIKPYAEHSKICNKHADDLDKALDKAPIVGKLHIPSRTG